MEKRKFSHEMVPNQHIYIKVFIGKNIFIWQHQGNQSVRKSPNSGEGEAD